MDSSLFLLCPSQYLSLICLSVTPFFSRFCVIFTIIILESFSGRTPVSSLFGFVGFYHVPSPAEYFSAFSFCLDCCVWDALSSGWTFMVPLNCGVCSLWVGLDQWVVEVSWLGELASVFWWVELDLFSLECSQVPSGEFWGAYGFGMVLGSCILMFGVVFLFCWRISVMYIALGLVGSWVELVSV